MKLVTRYLLRAFLGPLFTCLITFNSIFIIFDLFGNLSKIMDSEISFFSVIRYYAGLVSMYSAWFIPASCMLATLYTMWQLSHFSELTAMRASGISFHKLTVPFFAVSTAMAVLIIVNTELVLPDSSEWSSRMEESSFDDAKPQRKRNLLYVSPDGVYNWRFNSVDTSSYNGMKNPGALEVKWTENENGVDMFHGVRTDDARFLDGVWWFHFPHVIEFDIDGSELNTPNVTVDVPEYVPMYGLKDDPYDMFLTMRNWEFLSSLDMLRVISTHGQGDPEKMFDFWYRTAAPWACVVITIFAIPAGISTGRQSVIRGVIMALSSFFSFYALSMTLKFFGQQGVVPPALAAWLPNLLFLVIGAVMYRRLT